MQNGKCKMVFSAFSLYSYVLGTIQAWGKRWGKDGEKMGERWGK